MSIREQIRLLARYQDLDTQMHVVDQKLAEMPPKLTALESERERFEAEMVTKAAALEDQNKRYRGLEADLKQRQDSILKAQAKLSTVKTNKAYQAMLTEIEQIEKGCSALEDDILAILEAMDTAAAELETEKADLSQLKDRLSGEARSRSFRRIIRRW